MQGDRGIHDQRMVQGGQARVKLKHSVDLHHHPICLFLDLTALDFGTV